MHNPKFADRPHRINVPTLVVWGQSDRLVPKQVGEAFREKIHGARLTLINRAGHSPHIEQPEAFVPQIVTFAGQA